MNNIMQKFRNVAIVSGAALFVAACGGGENTADTGNATTTEMLSTETTLDGTTNDATSLDAAAGLNNEVVAPANEAAADNVTAQ